MSLGQTFSSPNTMALSLSAICICQPGTGQAAGVGCRAWRRLADPAIASRYTHWGSYFAKNGYAVFAIEYRLMKPGLKTYPGAVYDVKAAVQYVRAEAATLRVDSDRIALMGNSAGAHLAALVALARGGAAILHRVLRVPVVPRTRLARLTPSEPGRAMVWEWRRQFQRSYSTDEAPPAQFAHECLPYSLVVIGCEAAASKPTAPFTGTQ